HRVRDRSGVDRGNRLAFAAEEARERARETERRERPGDGSDHADEEAELVVTGETDDVGAERAELAKPSRAIVARALARRGHDDDAPPRGGVREREPGVRR